MKIKVVVLGFAGALALAAAALVLPSLADGSSSAEAASKTSVQVAPGAKWFNNGFQVDVYVTYQCDGGTGGLNVNVVQSTAFGPAQGWGGTQVDCNGSPNKAAVTVGIPCGPDGCFGPPFQLGNAQATAQLQICDSSGCRYASDTRTIRIR